jgi:hypothetical protein
MNIGGAIGVVRLMMMMDMKLIRTLMKKNFEKRTACLFFETLIIHMIKKEINNMKNFYSIEPKHDFKSSSSKYEKVEYDINTLILDEADLLLSDEDCSDEEFEARVLEKAKEIKEDLMRNGIWRNEFGQPVFLYC